MASPLVDGTGKGSGEKEEKVPGNPRSVVKASNSIGGAGSPSGKKGKQVPGAAEKNPSQEATIKSKEPASEEEETEEEETEEEEAEGEREIEEGGRDTGSGSGIVVRIETDVLDCSNCDGPLRPPIYERITGDMLCSECILSLMSIRPYCIEIFGLTRCSALERVIESIKVSCRNAREGCDETLSYINRADHQKSCIYTPCSCLLSSCSFRGSIASLSQHFIENHEDSAIEFSYFHCFIVTVTYEAFVILISQDNRLFLLINSDVIGGKKLSVICICPTTEDLQFMYELSVYNYPTDLKLESSAETIFEWESVHPKMYLFVPDGFSPDRKIKVNVSIQKGYK